VPVGDRASSYDLILCVAMSLPAAAFFGLLLTWFWPPGAANLRRAALRGRQRFFARGGGRLGTFFGPPPVRSRMHWG
jgi:hypothetical protein